MTHLPSIAAPEVEHVVDLAFRFRHLSFGTGGLLVHGFGGHVEECWLKGKFLFSVVVVDTRLFPADKIYCCLRHTVGPESGLSGVASVSDAVPVWICAELSAQPWCMFIIRPPCGEITLYLAM